MIEDVVAKENNYNKKIQQIAIRQNAAAN